MSGVLVGRGVLRNPWILAQASDVAAGRTPRPVSAYERGRFLLDYIDLLTKELIRDHGDVGSHDRWVINKIRALASWYTKGLDNGSHLRTTVNHVETLEGLRQTLAEFFGSRSPATVP